jgi:hypothetical protein
MAQRWKRHPHSLAFTGHHDLRGNWNTWAASGVEQFGLKLIGAGSPFQNVATLLRICCRFVAV